MRRPERTVRRPSSAECGPDFPWDVSRNCRSEHYDGWLQHRSYKFPILFIIRFPPHAVTAIVIVHAPAEAARTKKTQKDYKARTVAKRNQRELNCAGGFSRRMHDYDCS